MRLVLTLGLLLLACRPVPTMARPYAVEDLLSLESIGRVQFDPTERWLVIEHRRPWRSAARYDHNYHTNLMLTQLRVVDLNRPGPATPLFAQTPDAGYQAGPISPDGAHMLVYRLQDHRFEAGIVQLATRQVRWLGITPELPVHGRVAQWRSPQDLLLVARVEGETPRQLAIGWQAQARLRDAWTKTAEGREPTRTAIGSGRFLDQRPRWKPSRLLNLDVTSGALTELAQGEFIDLEVSPAGRHAALIANLEDLQPRPEDRIHVSFPTRRRGLVLVDLASGQITRPAADEDVALGLLSWSPSGQRLLLALRRPEGPVLAQIDATSGALSRSDLAGLTPDLSRNREGSTYLRADWLGEEPIVFARPAPGRADWYRLDARGPVNLTGALKAPARNLLALDGDHLTLIADDAVWAIDAQGRATRSEHGPGLAAVSINAEAGARARENPRPPRTPIATTEPGHVILHSWGRPSRLSLASRGEVLTASRNHAVVLTRSPSGLRRLSLMSSRGETTLILKINSGLAQVTPAEIAPVAHLGPQGERLTSWLYLPADRAAGVRLPLVVIPYRGGVYPTPYRYFDPGEVNTFLNPQILVGAGYAVLVPSLPYDDALGRPIQGVAKDILLAVDAALARGGLDPARIALYGHSFGALGSVAAASQSARFKSVIASAGLYDALSSWGTFPLHQWVVPEDGLPTVLTAGTVEGGQPRTDAPPWKDPERYRQASALFAADQLTAPVLLLHGDLDEVRVNQSQEMFSALYRQGKDAKLVTYWGEGHVINSPANIADMYATILDWLARTMPPAAPSPPSTPPKPPPSRS